LWSGLSLNGVTVMCAPGYVNVMLVSRPVIGSALLGCCFLEPTYVVRDESKQRSRESKHGNQWEHGIHLMHS
jgi:hypothetical protein